MYILVSLLEYGNFSGITQTKNIKTFVDHHNSGPRYCLRWRLVSVKTIYFKFLVNWIFSFNKRSFHGKTLAWRRIIKRIKYYYIEKLLIKNFHSLKCSKVAFENKIFFKKFFIKNLSPIKDVKVKFWSITKKYSRFSKKVS